MYYHISIKHDYTDTIQVLCTLYCDIERVYIKYQIGIIYQYPIVSTLTYM